MNKCHRAVHVIEDSAAGEENAAQQPLLIASKLLPHGPILLAAGTFYRPGFNTGAFAAMAFLLSRAAFRAPGLRC